jgi:hypothetical protein
MCVAVAVMSVLPTLVVAAPIFGTFSINGTITVGTSGGVQTIGWLNDNGTVNQATVGSTGLSGSFAGLGGQTVTIRPLTNPPNVVDAAGFPAQLFITFDSAPALGSLLINFIYQGVNSSAACGAAPAVGQTCALAGSPFDFQNTPGGGSRAGFVFSGTTPESTWQGNFTSQFNVPYQTVLGQAATGSVTNTYSATFDVTPIPEPGTIVTMWLGGLGLLLLSRYRRA